MRRLQKTITKKFYDNQFNLFIAYPVQGASLGNYNVFMITFFPAQLRMLQYLYGIAYSRNLEAFFMKSRSMKLTKTSCFTVVKLHKHCK